MRPPLCILPIIFVPIKEIGLVTDPIGPMCYGFWVSPHGFDMYILPAICRFDLASIDARMPHVDTEQGLATGYIPGDLMAHLEAFDPCAVQAGCCLVLRHGNTSITFGIAQYAIQGSDEAYRLPILVF